MQKQGPTVNWRRPAAAGALLLAVILPVVIALWIAPPPPPGPGQQPLPDFTAIDDVNELKERFFGYLAPIVEEANDDVRAKRERLQRIVADPADNDAVLRRDRRWLSRVAERYQVQVDSLDAKLTALGRRVDTIPAGLALAQAAIESGWGRSRFAREGNNLFGEWCFREGCGLVPAARPAHAQHEVRAFVSVGDAVRSYLHNLNTHRAYGELREMRARIRANEDRAPSTMELAAGLGRYSERGQAYVNEVRTVIRANDLD